MFKLFLLVSLVIEVFGDDKNVSFSKDDYKCSLPDVTSVDDNLDLTRFRSDFSKISEVKFPGLIGPLNERLICKIKCIDGNWVGPLCSTTPDGRFQPILRECLYKNDNPLLAISFKNESVLIDTYFPHGSIITARCKHFGLYKIKGDNVVRCENGIWSTKMPTCVPTSILTNFTAGAPPTIQYIAVTGSAIVESTGELYVYPGSTVWLDCLWPRALGEPDWSWTQSSNHISDWATDAGEVDLHYRLTLTKVSARHNDNFTCTSPTGHTNTITIKVVNIVCPVLNVSSSHVHQFAQGTRLGNAVHFSCQPGYHLNGSSVVYCMGDGRWSSYPPTCVETFCPTLRSLGPQLSVVEYNSSFGGRAVFACAWGYRLVGTPGLECENDGRWSGEIPHCIPIYCPDPLIPDNGRILTHAASKDGKYPVGFLIIYTCDEGYEINGEASIVCTENGFWSHPPPFCLLPSDIKETDMIYVDNTTMVHADE
ncbi:locomotion-related protein Hikaru genki-like [Aricia agestis]|uniref:locomotion-related protein Hikaru genki-like n=1 Tax=Aricia agestis TaxID=91739 RepID=UPI001C201EF5|nr:locomotion-related protein Hikaru genki-like [Aricia agestis]